MSSITPPHSRLVDPDAQAWEELGAPLYFVDDNQASGGFERQHRIRKEPEILGSLEIEQGRATLLASHELAGQRRLSHLARAKDRDHWKLAEQRVDLFRVAEAFDHVQEDTMKSERLSLRFQ